MYCHNISYRISYINNTCHRTILDKMEGIIDYYYFIDTCNQQLLFLTKLNKNYVDEIIQLINVVSVNTNE